MIVGTPWGEDGKVYNAVALLMAGKVETLRYKVDLPNYSVFDEKRMFAAGAMPGPVNFSGVRLGMPICEDIWTGDVCECLAESGAELFVVPNGSPFTLNKRAVRENVAVARVAETGLPLLYVNQVGGQDELVFDGGSFVLNRGGKLAVQLPAWETAIAMTEWRRERGGLGLRERPAARPLEEGRRRRLSRLRDRPSGLCREEPLSRRGAGPVGRRRLRARRGHGGRCAGRRRACIA